MGLTKLAIKLAIPLPKVDSFGKYLFVGPHPDDIEIGAGATVSKLVKKGKKVTFLIACDGRFGDGASGGIKDDELAELRRKETIASAQKLGVTDVRFLDLCDGAGYTFDELVSKLAVEIGKIKPDIIFAPDALSRSETHEDHVNVGKAVRYLANFGPYAGIMAKNYGAESADIKALALYMTARPNKFLRVSGDDFKAQLEALKLHASQYPAGSADYSSIVLYLKLRSVEYGLKHFTAHAEGFRIYDRTRMHCLPEAD